MQRIFRAIADILEAIWNCFLESIISFAIEMARLTFFGALVVAGICFKPDPDTLGGFGQLVYGVEFCLILFICGANVNGSSSASDSRVERMSYSESWSCDAEHERREWQNGCDQMRG